MKNSAILSLCASGCTQVARLPQRLKLNFFEKISSLQIPPTSILAFEEIVKPLLLTHYFFFHYSDMVNNTGLVRRWLIQVSKFLNFGLGRCRWPIDVSKFWVNNNREKCRIISKIFYNANDVINYPHHKSDHQGK